MCCIYLRENKILDGTSDLWKLILRYLDNRIAQPALICGPSKSLVKTGYNVSRLVG